MLRRFVFAALVIGIARPSPARAAGPEPEAKPDLQIEKALESPADRHGIPVDLYDLDSELASYRTALEHKEGTAQIQGIGGLVLMTGGVLAGLAAPDLVWAPFGAATGIPWGFAIAGVGVIVEMLFLGTLSGMEEQRRLLQDTFATRYQPRPVAAGHSVRGGLPGGLVVLRW